MLVLKSELSKLNKLLIKDLFYLKDYSLDIDENLYWYYRPKTLTLKIVKVLKFRESIYISEDIKVKSYRKEHKILGNKYNLLLDVSEDYRNIKFEKYKYSCEEEELKNILKDTVDDVGICKKIIEYREIKSKEREIRELLRKELEIEIREKIQKQQEDEWEKNFIKAGITKEEALTIFESNYKIFIEKVKEEIDEIIIQKEVNKYNFIEVSNEKIKQIIKDKSIKNKEKEITKQRILFYKKFELKDKVIEKILRNFKEQEEIYREITKEQLIKQKMEKYFNNSISLDGIERIIRNSKNDNEVEEKMKNQEKLYKNCKEITVQGFMEKELIRIIKSGKYFSKDEVEEAINKLTKEKIINYNRDGISQYEVKKILENSNNMSEEEIENEINKQVIENYKSY